jgi:hypothetical protein
MPLTDRDPHQPAGVVVNHRGEELVAALVGDLIDPEPGQAGEPVMQRLDIGPDPGDDRAHGAPGDPRWRYRRPRCLMDMSREPGLRIQRQLACHLGVGRLFTPMKRSLPAGGGRLDRPAVSVISRSVDFLGAEWEPAIDTWGERGSCPNCGSRDVKHIVFGYPSDPGSAPSWVRFGGCAFIGVPNDRLCEACCHSWGALTAPVDDGEM